MQNWRMNQQQTTRLNAFWQDVEAHKALNPSLPESALVILKSVALDALLAAQDIEQIGVNDANN
jgi:hypothetical protein